MVSSFIIHTSICIPKEYIRDFNDFMEEIQEIIHGIDGEVPVYFDSGSIDVGTDALDLFLRNDSSKKVPIQDLYTNWRCDERGYLYDNCEKFHGSISLLDYCIQEFFEPRDIVLNGNIIGVNTEYEMVFAYRVEDNIITLDESVTRGFLKIYENLVDIYNESDIHDTNIVDRITQLICDRMNIQI